MSPKKYTIIGAKGIAGYAPPDALHNDGYGDQQMKRPDVLAFDEISKRFVIGVVKTLSDDLESPHALTQDHVFFDHKNAKNGKPFAGLLYSSARVDRGIHSDHHALHPSRILEQHDDRSIKN